MEMPSIVTASQLRTVLGVSVSLYSDAYLDGIINSAEQAILPMLTANQNAVAAVYLQNNVAYFITQKPNTFVAGQSVIVTGCVPSTFNGTLTVTSNYYDPFPYLPYAYPAPYYVFTAAITNANITFRPVIPAGVAYLSGANAATLYANTEAIEQAILVVSVEIMQSVTAPGNTSADLEFNPQPFVLGRSLQNRVMGLLSPYIDVETMAQ
jgi:hypothetical protein